MRNSFRSYGINDSQLDEIWSVIDSFKDTNTMDKGSIMIDNHSNGLKRDINDESSNQSCNKKFKLSDDKTDCTIDEVITNDEFDWFSLIKNECAKKEVNLIKKLKLEKKVKIIN
jgi:hypothetical protein